MASPFQNALATFAQEDAANLAALRTLRTQSFEMIMAGGGEILQDISGTLNGKSFTFEVKFDCSELFTILTELLAALESDGSTHGRSVTFDFSQLRTH